MTKKFLLLIPLLYFWVLLQTSFLVHLNIGGFLPNSILISVAVLSFFAPGWGIPFALTGGFFLDIFSSHFIGLNVLIFLALVVFIQKILKKHVRSPVK